MSSDWPILVAPALTFASIMVIGALVVRVFQARGGILIFGMFTVLACCGACLAAAISVGPVS